MKHFSDILIEEIEADLAKPYLTKTSRFCRLSHREFFKYLDSSKTSNKFFNRNQFEKYKNDTGDFYCLLNGTQIEAAAFIVSNRLGLNDKYINEVQSLVSGKGKELLINILNEFKNVWLLSEPGNSKLITYYQQFNLNMFKLNNSCFNMPVYFFYKDLNPETFIAKISDYYC